MWKSYMSKVKYDQLSPVVYICMLQIMEEQGREAGGKFYDRDAERVVAVMANIMELITGAGLAMYMLSTFNKSRL